MGSFFLAIAIISFQYGFSFEGVPTIATPASSAYIWTLGSCLALLIFATLNHTEAANFERESGALRFYWLLQV